MKIRSVMGAMVVAGTLLAAPAVYAAPAAVSTSHAAKVKMVKFTLLNDSSSTLKVKVAGNEISLEPGKPMEVKVPEGQQIVMAEATSNHEAGSVITTVTSAYSGNTVNIR